MPQLDISTYLGQVTSFAVVFTLYYFVTLVDVLPRLNRIIKLRVKKLDTTSDDARQFDSERTTSDSSHAHSTAASTLSSYVVVTSTHDGQKSWVATEVVAISNTLAAMESAHSSYLGQLVMSDMSVGVVHQIMTDTALTDADMMLDAPRLHSELFA